MEKDRLADRPATTVHLSRSGFGLAESAISQGPTGRRKSHKALVLYCQAFVSGLEDEEASYLGSSPSYYLVVDSLPICLLAWEAMDL